MLLPPRIYAHKLLNPQLDDRPPLSLPDITPWMHKHVCAPHITPPQEACMALVPHCDTNQGRWRAPLSCKHQSLLVLFKCLPSLFLCSLTLAQPLPCFLQPPLTTSALSLSFPHSLCLSFSSPRKSSAKERMESPLVEAWGSACVSAHGAISSPNQVHFIFKCYNQASDPQGGSLWLRPQVAGSRW